MSEEAEISVSLVPVTEPTVKLADQALDFTVTLIGTIFSALNQGSQLDAMSTIKIVSLAVERGLVVQDTIKVEGEPDAPGFRFSDAFMDSLEELEALTEVQSQTAEAAE